MPDPERNGEEEKIILNGGSAGKILIGNAALLEEACKTIYSFTEHSHFDPADATALVEAANKLEDAALDYQKKVFRFQKRVLEAVGFTGPFPASMS